MHRKAPNVALALGSGNAVLAEGCCFQDAGAYFGWRRSTGQG